MSARTELRRQLDASEAADLAAILDDETIDHLRWVATSPSTIAIVDKPVLTALLDAYERVRRMT